MSTRPLTHAAIDHERIDVEGEERNGVSGITPADRENTAIPLMPVAISRYFTHNAERQTWDWRARCAEYQGILVRMLDIF